MKKTKTPDPALKTPNPALPLTWKQRLEALRNLPRFFRLVWQTSPRIMIVNAFLRIARSATPVAILYVGKLIIDQVIYLDNTKTHTTDPDSNHHLWELIALEFRLA